MIRTPLILAAAAAALALAPAPASADAGCTLQFDVAFDGAGRFAQVGAGQALCAGAIGGVALVPEAAEAAIAGVARPGRDACSPAFESGRLRFHPRRLVAIFEPQHLDVFGDWLAVAPGPATALTGTAASDSSTTPIVGDLRFTPRAGDCSGSTVVPGRLRIDLVLSGSQPAQRQQPPAEPAKSESEPAPPAAAPAKARARARKSCRRPRTRSRAAKRRAARRCKRAARARR